MQLEEISMKLGIVRMKHGFKMKRRLKVCLTGEMMRLFTSEAL
jgi:hypothetical protein